MGKETYMVEYAANTSVEEVPEGLVELQVEAFMARQEDAIHFTELYKQTYTDSQFLLSVESSDITNPELKDKLEAVQRVMRGNGGA